MRNPGLLLLLCSILFSINAKSFKVDSTNVRVYGRCDFSTVGEITYDWSGTRFDFVCTGPSIALRFKDNGNHYDIYINDTKQERLITTYADSVYTIASELAEVEHRVRVERRTELTWGKATFKEIILDDNGTLLPAQAKPQKRYLQLGDSYTTGYGNEYPSKEGNQEDFVNTTNTGLAFGSLVGKHYDAEYVTLGFSGKGLIRNANGDSPGKEYPLYFDHLYNSEINIGSTNPTTWDHSSWKPHIIAINLGINDFSGDSVEPADTLKWRARYGEFIDTLLTYYPKCAIIVMSTGDWPHNRLRASAKAVVDTAQNRGQAVYLYDYSVAASALHWHPSVSEHEEISEGLIALIDANELWKSSEYILAPIKTIAGSISFSKSGKVQLRNIEDSAGSFSLYSLDGKCLIKKEIILRKGSAKIKLPELGSKPLIAEFKTTQGIIRRKVTLTP